MPQVSTKPRKQLTFDDVAKLVGPKAALRLISRHGGQTLPNAQDTLRMVRNRSVLYDYLHRHCTVPELMAKYQLPKTTVVRLINTGKRKLLDADTARPSIAIMKL